MKVCLDLKDMAFPIQLKQQGRNKFTAVYGKQICRNLSYGSACTQLGASIMHALACDGKLDNGMPGEK